LVQRHQMLCRVSARHYGTEIGLDRIRLHGGATSDNSMPQAK
jgi:hypothetical protein